MSEELKRSISFFKRRIDEIDQRLKLLATRKTNQNNGLQSLLYLREEKKLLKSRDMLQKYLDTQQKVTKVVQASQSSNILLRENRAVRAQENQQKPSLIGRLISFFIGKPASSIGNDSLSMETKIVTKPLSVMASMPDYKARVTNTNKSVQDDWQQRFEALSPGKKPLPDARAQVVIPKRTDQQRRELLVKEESSKTYKTEPERFYLQQATKIYIKTDSFAKASEVLSDALAKKYITVEVYGNLHTKLRSNMLLSKAKLLVMEAIEEPNPDKRKVLTANADGIIASAKITSDQKRIIRSELKSWAENHSSVLRTSSPAEERPSTFRPNR